MKRVLIDLKNILVSILFGNTVEGEIALESNESEVTWKTHKDKEYPGKQGPYNYYFLKELWEEAEITGFMNCEPSAYFPEDFLPFMDDDEKWYWLERRRIKKEEEIEWNTRWSLGYFRLSKKSKFMPI